MRLAIGMGFGLVGLIVCIGIIAIMFGNYTSQVSSSGSMARQQAEQLAGVDSDLGGRVSSQVRLQPQSQGSQLQYLIVKSITPGSSYQSYYGLMPNDYIDQVGPQMVKDISDGDMANALAMEAYQRQWELGIWRGGKRFMLPTQKALAAMAMPPSPATPAPVAQPAQPQAAQPSQPTPTPQPAKPQQPYVSPLQRQLDAIQNAGQQRDQQ